jgi:hypothetical protein
VTKGGTTPLQEVYEYAEPIDKAGLVFTSCALRPARKTRSEALGLGDNEFVPCDLGIVS